MHNEEETIDSEKEEAESEVSAAGNLQEQRDIDIMETETETAETDGRRAPTDRTVIQSLAQNPAPPRPQEDQQISTETPSAVPSSIFGPSSKPTDDSWIDDWDFTVHRCYECNRPFGTQPRLLEHRRIWHSIDSPALEAYTKPESQSDPDYSGEDEPVEIIANEGDLLLYLKSSSGNRQWLVASQVLWVTSPVFCAMFGPSSVWQEARKVRQATISGNPPAVINLEDDDPSMLAIVLAILHHRADLVPNEVSFRQMVQFAAVCDKYGLQRLGAIQSTADKLSQRFRQYMDQDGYEDWLLIAYVFGYEDAFTKVSQDLIVRAAVLNTELYFAGRLTAVNKRTADGSARPKRKYYKFCQNTPESVLEKLAEERLLRVETLRNTLNRIHDERRHVRGQGPSKRCTDIRQSNPTFCQALQLGHLVSIISEHQLDEDEIWNGSLKTLCTTFSSIKGMVACYGHERCSWVPELHKIADASLSGIKGLKLSDFPSRSSG